MGDAVGASTQWKQGIQRDSADRSVRESMRAPQRHKRQEIIREIQAMQAELMKVRGLVDAR